jgi:hypothetical protein
MAWRGAGEHVVRRDVHGERARGGGGPRDETGAGAVDPRGLRLGGLRAVDVGPGGAVDHRIGARGADRPGDGRPVGDVQLGSGERHRLATSVLGGALYVETEHPARARDQDPHRRVG